METLKFLMVSSHFPPYHLGGDGAFVGYLSDELIRRGHEVTVLYSPNVYRVLRGREPATRNRVDEANLRRYAYDSRSGRLGPLLALFTGWSHGAKATLDNLAKELKPDVVHWHNTKGFIGCPIAVKGSVNLYTAHDFYSICPRSNLLRPGTKVCEKPRFCQLCLLRWKKPPQLWRVGGRRVFRLPPDLTTLAPSDYLAGRLAEEGIRVNHTLRNFVPDKRRLIASRKERTTILFLGVLEVLKGPHILLEAFANTRDKQGFDLRIIGEGSLKKELVKRVAKLGLDDRVKLPGFVPLADLSSTLKETAFLVIPTVAYENSPLAAMEAFSMGIPVIGSDLGGLPEILDSESGSKVFQASSAESLGACLRLLWDQRSDLDGMGRKARRAYELRFSPETHIRNYMKIITGQHE